LIGRGIVAGLAATVVLSLLMIMKQAMGLMPQLNSVAMLTQMMGAQTPLVGWLAHFVIGVVVWGMVFAWIDSRLSYAHWINGVIFATGAWLIMMIAIMPLAGAGLFGLNLGLGIMAPLATLMLHWIYGAVLGAVYGMGTRINTASANVVGPRHA